jgi:hypothetical protein
MRVGVFYFNPDYGINIAELARALEARGFASFYVPEHTHIPTSRRTPFPRGGELPKCYEAKLAEYRQAGIDEALLEIPDLSRDEILQLLDRYAPLAAA